MPRLMIDGKTITVDEGTTILDAARAAGIIIPALCVLPGRAPEPSCLVCVVKDDASGRLVPSCAARAENDMRILTRAPEALAARARVLDLLVAEHVGDCEAPCRRGCPLFIDVDRVLGRMRTGDGAGAVAAVLEHNPFPSLMGRLCHAPCEKVCRRGRADGAVSIRLLEKYLGDAMVEAIPTRAPATGKRVAIAGAGPAGLGAAWHLALLGHEVVVYERQPLPGGGLRAALAHDTDGLRALDREIGRITALGVKMIFGVAAGVDRPWPDRTGGRSALVISCGDGDPGRFRDAGVTLTAEGVGVDRETFAASRPGVFAAGSAVKKTEQAVHALRQGRAAAQAAHAYLMTGAAAPEKKLFDSHVRGLTADELAGFMRSAARAPRHVLEPGAGSASAETARAEADRCLACGCLKRTECVFREAVSAHGGERRTRLEKRPPVRRVDSHPDVVLETGKCVKCGRCVRLCRERKEPLGLAFLGRGFDMTVGVPFGRPLAEGLTVAAAECVAACPTAALAWKRGRKS